MKIAAWNIRGLNDKCKQTEIRKVIFDNQLALLCIVETKVRRSNIDKVRRNCMPNWGLLHNTPGSGVGRVWIIWDVVRLDVALLKNNKQSIDCMVTVRDNGKHFVLSGVYGLNDRVGRYDLWRDLRSTYAVINGLPWLIMGDFNIVRKQEERKGGNPVDSAEMEDFNDCIQDIQVQDMVSK